MLLATFVSHITTWRVLVQRSPTADRYHRARKPSTYTDAAKQQWVVVSARNMTSKATQARLTFCLARELRCLAMILKVTDSW